MSLWVSRLATMQRAEVPFFSSWPFANLIPITVSCQLHALTYVYTCLIMGRANTRVGTRTVKLNRAMHIKWKLHMRRCSTFPFRVENLEKFTHSDDEGHKK